MSSRDDADAASMGFRSSGEVSEWQRTQQKADSAQPVPTDAQIMAHVGGPLTSMSDSRPLGQQWDMVCNLVRAVLARAQPVVADTLTQAAQDLLDTELSDLACTGSDAPVEDALGRLRDALASPPRAIPAEQAAPTEPIAWAIPSTKQFSWDQQDTRYWTPLVAAHPHEAADRSAEAAYWQGWCEAADWAKRDDLYADRDSDAYEKAMRRRLAAMGTPAAAEPGKGQP